MIDQQADHRGGEQPLVEAGLVAGEPAVGADRAEDRQDHRERGGDRQDAAAPAEDEEGEEGVEQRRRSAQMIPMPPPPVISEKPVIVISADERRRRREQEDEHELGRDRLGFFPIWPPQFVARPDLSYRHANDHRI